MKKGTSKSPSSIICNRSTLNRHGNITSSILSSNLGGGDIEELFINSARDGAYDRVLKLLDSASSGVSYLSINLKDKRTGNTALIWACKRGHGKIVQLLLNHGADITLKNYNGESALEVASSAIKQMILDNVDHGGVSYTQRLLQAAWIGNHNLVNEILSKSPILDLECVNYDGLTPLLLCTTDLYKLEKLGPQLLKHYEPSAVVNDLLQCGADTLACDSEGKTALHHCACSKAAVALPLTALLSQSTKIDIQDKRHRTPLHYACQAGNTDIVQLLLDCGSDVNSQCFAGTTPLHIAAFNNQEHLAKILLHHGADPHAVDDSGHSPIDVARFKKFRTMLRTWRRTGRESADLHAARVSSGNTALGSAHKFTDVRIQEILSPIENSSFARGIRRERTRLLGEPRDMKAAASPDGTLPGLTRSASVNPAAEQHAARVHRVDSAQRNRSHSATDVSTLITGSKSIGSRITYDKSKGRFSHISPPTPRLAPIVDQVSPLPEILASSFHGRSESISEDYVAEQQQISPTDDTNVASRVKSRKLNATVIKPETFARDRRWTNPSGGHQSRIPAANIKNNQSKITKTLTKSKASPSMQQPMMSKSSPSGQQPAISKTEASGKKSVIAFGKKPTMLTKSELVVPGGKLISRVSDQETALAMTSSITEKVVVHRRDLLWAGEEANSSSKLLANDKESSSLLTNDKESSSLLTNDKESSSLLTNEVQGNHSASTSGDNCRKIRTNKAVRTNKSVEIIRTSVSTKSHEISAGTADSASWKAQSKNGAKICNAKSSITISNNSEASKLLKPTIITGNDRTAESSQSQIPAVQQTVLANNPEDLSAAEYSRTMHDKHNIKHGALAGNGLAVKLQENDGAVQRNNIGGVDRDSIRGVDRDNIGDVDRYSIRDVDRDNIGVIGVVSVPHAVLDNANWTQVDHILMKPDAIITTKAMPSSGSSLPSTIASTFNTASTATTSGNVISTPNSKSPSNVIQGQRNDQSSKVMDDSLRQTTNDSTLQSQVDKVSHLDSSNMQYAHSMGTTVTLGDKTATLRQSPFTSRVKKSPPPQSVGSSKKASSNHSSQYQPLHLLMSRPFSLAQITEQETDTGDTGDTGDTDELELDAPAESGHLEVEDENGSKVMEPVVVNQDKAFTLTVSQQQRLRNPTSHDKYNGPVIEDIFEGFPRPLYEFATIVAQDLANKKAVPKKKKKKLSSSGTPGDSRSNSGVNSKRNKANNAKPNISKRKGKNTKKETANEKKCKEQEALQKDLDSSVMISGVNWHINADSDSAVIGLTADEGEVITESSQLPQKRSHSFMNMSPRQKRDELKKMLMLLRKSHSGDATANDTATLLPQTMQAIHEFMNTVPDERELDSLFGLDSERDQMSDLGAVTEESIVDDCSEIDLGAETEDINQPTDNGNGAAQSNADSANQSATESVSVQDKVTADSDDLERCISTSMTDIIDEILNTPRINSMPFSHFPEVSLRLYSDSDDTDSINSETDGQTTDSESASDDSDSTVEHSGSENSHSSHSGSSTTTGAASKKNTLSFTEVDNLTINFPLLSAKDLSTSLEAVINPEMKEITTEAEESFSNLLAEQSSAIEMFGAEEDGHGEIQHLLTWKKGNILGKGAFGTVYCGLTSDGHLIAVKQIELNVHDWEKAEKEYESIQEEVELLKNLNHRNIVGFLGTSLDNHVVSIYMQFVPGGTIASLLDRFGVFEERVFQRYTKQIVDGVHYLHSNGVIHRDIKGGNIMLMSNAIIKLIDFGCAKKLYCNLSFNQSEILKSMKGTPYWMAPEVIKETGHGHKSDIWSVGCTVFEMATTKPPWFEMPPMAAVFAIGSDKPIPVLPSSCSPQAKAFVALCLQRDQRNRSTASELLNSPFLASYIPSSS